MIHRLFFECSALLLIASAPIITPTAIAQVNASDSIDVIDLRTEIAAVQYSASATIAAIQRSNDSRVLNLRREISALRLRAVTAEEAGNAEAKALHLQLTEEIERLVATLAEKDETYSRAIFAFRKSIEDISQTQEGLRALALFNDGDEIGAISILDDLRAANNFARNIENASEARSIARLALEAYETGELTAAQILSRFEEIVELDPNYAWDWRQLGKLRRSIGKITGSKQAYQAAERLSKDYRERVMALTALAYVAKDLGELQDAIKHAEAVQSLIVNNSNEVGVFGDLYDLSVAQSLLGNLYISASQHSKGIEYHKKSLSTLSKIRDERIENELLDRRYHQCLVNLGHAYFQSLSFEKSKTSFLRAETEILSLIKRHPNTLIYKSDLIGVYIRLGQIASNQSKHQVSFSYYEKAFALVGKLIDADSANTQYIRNLATISAGLADAKANLGDFKTSLELRAIALNQQKSLHEKEPENFQYIRDLHITHWRMANVYAKQKNYDSALYHLLQSEVFIDQVLTKSPDDSKAIVLKYAVLSKGAEVLQKLEKYSEARTILKEAYNLISTALVLSPENNEWKKFRGMSLSSLGRLEQNLGNADLALEYYLEAHALYQDWTQSFPNSYSLQWGFLLSKMSIFLLTDQQIYLESAYETALTMKSKKLLRKGNMYIVQDLKKRLIKRGVEVE